MALDTSPFERARRGIDNDFAAKTSANTFGRFTSQQRFSRAKSDGQRGFQRGLPRMQAGYGRRGLTGPGVRSGVYQRALQDYATDYQRGQNQLQQDFDAEQNQYGLELNRYQAERESAIADLELDKAKQIATAAANLQALIPAFS